MRKKLISILMSLVIFCSCFVYNVSLAAVAYGLDLNVLAVNCYSGKLSNGATLSIQYSDATLGDDDSVKLYAQVKNNQNNTSSDVIEVCALNYTNTARNAFESTTLKTAQNKMGVAQFNFPSTFTDYDAAHYTVAVWSKDSSGKTSSVSYESINDKFDGASSDWSNVDSKKWLSYIDDSQPISQINLPGTHDSASVKFSSLESYNKTQNIYVDEQLNCGVRYLDIRVNGTLDLSDTSLSTGTTDYATCHASYDALNSDGTTYTLSQVLKSCYDFLNANPTEFIYFNVQQDNDKTRNDENFQKTIKEYIAKNPDKWFVKSYNPTLGEVRGKLIYARRFENGGVDADNVTAGGTRFYWDALEGDKAGDSSSTYVTGTAVQSNGNINDDPHEIVYHVQDYYKLGAGDKWTVAERLLDNNCAGKPLNEYFLNYLSSAGPAGFLGAPTTTPKAIADSVNSNFSNYNMEIGKRYGWVVFDFVTEALAKKVYSTNIKSAVESTSTANNKTILHYDFSDIGTNNIVSDLSGNGFDGKLANVSSITKSNDGYITLKNSGKNALDGAGVDIPSYAFRGTNNSVSISFYIKPTATGNKTLFSMGNLQSESSGYGTPDNWLVAITSWNGSGPRFASRTKGCGETNYNPSNTLTQNKWQLLTYVIDGSTLTIYKNSTKLGTYKGINASFDDVGNVVPISLGRATYWHDEDYVGAIGDFKVYNYAISTTDMANNFNQLAAIKSEVKVGNTVDVSKEFKNNFSISSFTDWTSSTPSVATVDSKGVVTGVSEGETTITAKSSTLTISCVVTVELDPTANTSSNSTSSSTTSVTSSNITSSGSSDTSSNVSSNTSSDITSSGNSNTSSNVSSNTSSDITSSGSSDTSSNVSSNTSSDITSSGNSDTSSNVSSNTSSDITSSGNSDTSSNVSSNTSSAITSSGSSNTSNNSSSSDTSTNKKPDSTPVTPSVVSVKGLSLNKSEVKLNIGKTTTVTATVSPSNATNKNLKWTSENNGIATVTNGVIKGVAPGITKVKAVTTDSSKIYKVVTVKVMPNKVTKVKATKKSSNKFKITFKKQSKISGVEICIKKNNGKFMIVKKGNVKSFTTGKLKKGKYSVKVRSYKKNVYGTIYGKYSSVYKFKVK